MHTFASPHYRWGDDDAQEPYASLNVSGDTYVEAWEYVGLSTQAEHIPAFRDDLPNGFCADGKDCGPYRR